MHKEGLQRYLHWLINFIKSLDSYTLWIDLEIHEAFQAHFRDLFAHLLHLPMQQFGNFPHLHKVKAARCEWKVTKSIMHCSRLASTSRWDWMKCTWGCYLFVAILTDTIGFCLDKSPRVWSHYWRNVAGMYEEDQDDYRPITLLNTVLKILGSVLANRFPIVTSDLIWIELCCEGKIHLKQPTLGSQDHRGDRRRQWSPLWSI